MRERIKLLNLVSIALILGTIVAPTVISASELSSEVEVSQESKEEKTVKQLLPLKDNKNARTVTLSEAPQDNGQLVALFVDEKYLESPYDAVIDYVLSEIYTESNPKEEFYNVDNPQVGTYKIVLKANNFANTTVTLTITNDNSGSTDNTGTGNTSCDETYIVVEKNYKGTGDKRTTTYSCETGVRTLIVQRYSNGKVHYKYDFYTNGRVKTKKTYRNDSKNTLASETKQYNQSNGQKQWHANFYVNGEKSKHQSYSSNGYRTGLTAYYSSGKKSEERKYFSSGKLKQLDSWYSNGKKKAKFTYHSNGKPYTRFTYRNDTKNSISTYYRKNNVSRLELYKKVYNNGKDQEVRKYYSSGKIKSLDSFYSNGKKKAKFTYHSNGKPRTRRTYRNDARNSLETYYDKDSRGKLKLYKILWSNGKNQEVRKYSNGKIISKTYYNMYGQKVHYWKAPVPRDWTQLEIDTEKAINRKRAAKNLYPLKTDNKELDAVCKDTVEYYAGGSMWDAERAHPQHLKRVGDMRIITNALGDYVSDNPTGESFAEQWESSTDGHNERQLTTTSDYLDVKIESRGNIMYVEACYAINQSETN